MSEHALKEINFARYQRWLDRAAGGETAFMVFNSKGQALWGSTFPQAEQLGQLILSSNPNEPGMQHQDVGTDKTALFQPLGFTNEGHLLGNVAILVDRFEKNNAPIQLDELAESLTDLAEGMFNEYSNNTDLDSITEELGARYEELHLVYAVDKHVQAHSGSMESVFQTLLESTAKHLDVDVVAFVRPEGNICLYATSLSKEIHNLDLVLIEMRGDLFRFVQASGETQIMNANDDDRRAYIFTDMPYKVLACPVKTESNIDAMVALLNHQHKPDFTNSDRKLAEVLTNQLASLSNTFKLVESMQQFNEQLAKALIEAVEAKDPYTRGHSDRVHYISMELGKAMGLPHEELEDLHWGSLLHDVGKIGIPDAVLCKPSRLTQDEYTFIMVHPERSYEILRHIKHLDKAVLGARHHQEMYDGKGYPHGLKGVHIPLHGRIIAVADTYDSITSSRAYRAGRSHEVAMKEIDRVSGAQLDPDIVEVFKKIVADEPEWIETFSIKRDKG